MHRCQSEALNQHYCCGIAQTLSSPTQSAQSFLIILDNLVIHVLYYYFPFIKTERPNYARQAQQGFDSMLCVSCGNCQSLRLTVKLTSFIDNNVSCLFSMISFSRFRLYLLYLIPLSCLVQIKRGKDSELDLRNCVKVSPHWSIHSWAFSKFI